MSDLYDRRYHYTYGPNCWYCENPRDKCTCKPVWHEYVHKSALRKLVDRWRGEANYDGRCCEAAIVSGMYSKCADELEAIYKEVEK